MLPWPGERAQFCVCIYATERSPADVCLLIGRLRSSGLLLPASGRTRTRDSVRGFQDLRAIGMTNDERYPSGKRRTGQENPESAAWFFSPMKEHEQNPPVEEAEMEKAAMELRVQLKICEGCGCLWYRAQTHEGVYCRGCEEKLRDFPSPESRKQRGRPKRKPHMKVWQEAEAIGGVQ